MRRLRTLLLYTLIIVGLTLPSALLGEEVISVGQTGAASGTIQTDAGTDLLAGKKSKRKHDRKQKQQKKKDRKQDRKQKDRKHKRQRDRQNQKGAAQQNGQPVELPTGILPGAESATPTQPAPDPSEGPAAAEGRYIIRLKPGGGDELATANAIAAANPGVTPTHVYRNVFPGFAAVIPPDKLDAVRNDPRVAAVVADRVVHTMQQEIPTGIERIDTLDNLVADINNDDPQVDVDVAIIDTAGDGTHEDLNIHAWANCTPSPNNSDDDGHGTHVGGTVGAIDNTLGVVGVAPGARLWNIRVLVDGSGFDSWIICGLDLVTQYATPQGDELGDIEVANMSLGGPGSDSANCGLGVNDLFHQAVCRVVDAGVTLVVSAGNESENAAFSTPAAYNEVITVSALADSDGAPGGLGDFTPDGADDSLAGFSNFGKDVDIAAPGVNILSTVPGDDYDGAFSGTSMASPHVAGAAALFMATHPNATPAQVKSALLASDEPGPIDGDLDGSFEGVINVGSNFSPSATNGSGAQETAVEKHGRERAKKEERRKQR